MATKKEQKDMAGDYEVLQKIRLGGKVLIFGYNPKDAEAPYMTCYQQAGFGAAICIRKRLAVPTTLKSCRPF